MSSPQRRHSTRGKNGPLVLDPRHIAMIEDRPLFPSMVRSAASVDRVLKQGRHSKKLGSHFNKGPWRGMPIYTPILARAYDVPSILSGSERMLRQPNADGAKVCCRRGAVY